MMWTSVAPLRGFVFVWGSASGGTHACSCSQPHSWPSVRGEAPSFALAFVDMFCFLQCRICLFRWDGLSHSGAACVSSSWTLFPGWINPRDTACGAISHEPKSTHGTAMLCRCGLVKEHVLFVGLRLVFGVCFLPFWGTKPP